MTQLYNVKNNIINVRSYLYTWSRVLINTFAEEESNLHNQLVLESWIFFLFNWSIENFFFMMYDCEVDIKQDKIYLSNGIKNEWSTIYLHWEKKFDWMKENNWFVRLFFIQTKDVFKLNNICLNLKNLKSFCGKQWQKFQTQLIHLKYLFNLNKSFL